MQPTIEIDRTKDELMDLLERRVSHLAMMWRGNIHKNPQRAEEIVKEYHVVLKCLIELGFKQSLYVDSELPDELMPPEYLALFT
jgi:hypothetical protein